MKNEREDFPDLMSPMLVKELRQGMRTKIFTLAFVLLQVLMVIMMSLNAMDYGNNPDAFRIKDLNGMFWSLCGVLLLVVMPLRGVVALSNEERAKTLELIFLTRLTSWRIVFGKWASLIFQSILFALAVLPYAVLRYFFGNVNLIDDLILLGLLLWASSLLTTITVGISGFSGFIKGALLIVAGIFGLPVAGFLIDALFGSGMARLGLHSITSTPQWLLWTLLLVNSFLAGLYFLEMAASHIAPDAENHMMKKRFLALICLLLAVILTISGVAKEVVVLQFVVAAGALILCCAEAMCSSRPIMQAHVDAFASKGVLAAWLGRFFYPGWPSGAAFSFLTAGLLMLVLWTLPGADDQIRTRGSVVILAGITGLLTPLVLFSLVMKRWRQVFGPFFIVQVTCMLIALFAFAASEITKQRFPIFVLSPLPPASFWLILFQAVKTHELDVFLTMSGIALLIFLILLLIWSRPFWQRLRGMELYARAKQAALGERKSRAEAAAPASAEDGA